MGFLDDKIPEYEERLAIARGSGDRYAEANMLRNLANIYSTRSDVRNFSKASSYYTQAVEIYYELQDWLEFYRGHINLGLIYEKFINDPQRALEIYKRAVTRGSDEVVGDAERERSSLRYMVERLTQTLNS